MKAQAARTPSGPPPVRNHPLDLWCYLRAFRRDPIAFVQRRFDACGDIHHAHHDPRWW